MHFGDRQTDKQMDSSDALSRSRYRERRLINARRNAVNALKFTNVSINLNRAFAADQSIVANLLAQRKQIKRMLT